MNAILWMSLTLPMTHSQSLLLSSLTRSSISCSILTSFVEVIRVVYALSSGNANHTRMEVIGLQNIIQNNKQIEFHIHVPMGERIWIALSALSYVSHRLNPGNKFATYDKTCFVSIPPILPICPWMYFFRLVIFVAIRIQLLELS